MKFAIQVNSSPCHSNAGHTAYQFINAALAQGHDVFRVFFITMVFIRLSNTLHRPMMNFSLRRNGVNWRGAIRLI
jgi:sulfur relay (sulfurtransferase) complex TusBCD TusD component (DsrE family)